MNFDLWEQVLHYTTNKKFSIPKTYIPNKVLKRKVTEKFVMNKFLETWIGRSEDNPIDILDDMLLKYYIWEENAKETNNQHLLDIYDIYIKTLIGVKNYILKETQ